MATVVLVVLFMHVAQAAELNYSDFVVERLLSYKGHT